MESYLIDVPMPSMGATVNELTVISLKVIPGETVKKGQHLAELESDKSIFEFESPCDGKISAIMVKAGEIKPSGGSFLQIETIDASLRHLASRSSSAPAASAVPASPKVATKLVWTPRALKLAQEAGLDPAQVTEIAATGPGGRVSGDDVTAFLAHR